MKYFKDGKFNPAYLKKRLSGNWREVSPNVGRIVNLPCVKRQRCWFFTEIPKDLKKIDAVREILTSNRRSPPQGALTWLWARSEQTVPILGFRAVKQVEENCGALNFGPLANNQMQGVETLPGRMYFPL